MEGREGKGLGMDERSLFGTKATSERQSVKAGASAAGDKDRRLYRSLLPCPGLSRDHEKPVSTDGT